MNSLIYLGLAESVMVVEDGILVLIGYGMLEKSWRVIFRILWMDNELIEMYCEVEIVEHEILL